MCNCGSKLELIMFFCLGVFFVTACATPKHSNTLIFGTNTKFALDVSADPSGSPSITVGYKRQEAVWMPLLANKDKEGSPAECSVKDCPYLYIGKEDNKQDTYSVLASFGAKFSGQGDTSGAKAEGGLAQYFATGLAARTLAKEGGARLVSVQPADSELYEEAKKKGVDEVKERVAKKAEILSFVAPNNTLDTSKWESLIDKTDLTDKIKAKLKELKDFNSVNQRLEMDAAMNGTEIEALYDKLNK